MALTVYKIVDSIRWKAGTTLIRPTSGGGMYIPPTNLSNYYTKIELNLDGGSVVHFGNIIEAYHNNLLNLQGGLDTSSGDSSGYDAEYYHLDASTYYDITGISFNLSIEKDSINAVHLVNDEDSPGINKYYGTSTEGLKGWYDLPETGLSSGDIIGYTFGYSIIEDSGFIVTLVNDVASPGNNYYYGTDSGGTKGWYSLPDWTFAYSLTEDSLGVVTLVNDEDTPGNSKYYGTNNSGVKGWFALPEEDSSGQWGDIYTFNLSIIEDSVGIVTLVNDSDAPGNSKYYGTDSGGVKGWFDLPSSSEMDSSAISEFYVFDMSLNEDSIGVVTLVNDETSPGNNKYYGTDGSGVKGWFDLPTYETGSSGEWGIYTFGYSLSEDSIGFVTLLNDVDSPGANMYYGTDISGVKGWHELSITELGSSGDWGIYDFNMSLVDDGTGSVTLDNDSATPGNNKLYGTNSGGTKGWFDIPSVSGFVDVSGTPSINQFAIWTDANTITGSSDISYDGRTFVFGGYPIDIPDVAKTNIGIGTILVSYTSAVESIFIGKDTGLFNTSGSYNVSIGPTALFLNSSGSYNVAIGPAALAINETASYNIAIGLQAIAQNTTGEYNTAIGINTLSFNNTGSYNTAIGWKALYSNLYGLHNVGIGVNALGHNENGNYNIAMGTNAGAYYNEEGEFLYTEQNYSIYLGANTQPLAATDENEIVIGYEAIGKGSNTTIIGNYDTIATYLAGEIYFITYSESSGGSETTGSLPLADSSITQVVMYDPATGKLYYGAGEGGTVSYTFSMSLNESSAGTVTLDNDSATPGNSKYYGTDSGGTKGWFDLPEGGSGGGGIDGSGANTRVAYWTDADTLSSDSDLYWDNNLNITQAGTNQTMLGPMYMGMYETVGGTIRCALLPGRGSDPGADYAYLFDTTSSLGVYKLASFMVNGSEKAFINSVGLSAIKSRATDFIWRYIIGDDALVTHAAEAVTDESSYTKLKTITLGANVNLNTTLRIKFDLKVETGSGAPVYGRIYRNGAAVGTEREDTTGTYQTFSQDITGWSAGDTLELYARTNAGDTDYSAYVRNFNICGSHNSTMLYEVTGATS